MSISLVVSRTTARGRCLDQMPAICRCLRSSASAMTTTQSRSMSPFTLKQERAPLPFLSLLSIDPHPRIYNCSIFRVNSVTLCQHFPCALPIPLPHPLSLHLCVQRANSPLSSPLSSVSSGSSPVMAAPTTATPSSPLAAAPTSPGPNKRELSKATSSVRTM